MPKPSIVRVVKRGDRALGLRYQDGTGKEHEISSGTKNYRDATEKALELEKRLIANPRKMVKAHDTWSHFVELYEYRLDRDCRPSTYRQWKTARRWFEEFTDIKNPNQVTPLLLESFYEHVLAATGNQTTAYHYHACIKTAINWGYKKRLVRERVDTDVSLAAVAKSRAVTEEEFDRLLNICETVRPGEGELWKQFLLVLWHTGLRAANAYQISTDPTDPVHCFWGTCVDPRTEKAERLLLIRVDHSVSKNKSEIAPATTQEAEDLLAPSMSERGYVLELRQRYSLSFVQRTVREIGKQAGVITRPADDPRGIKYASCHDLRRGLVTRLMEDIQNNALAQVAGATGHRHMAVTESYYYTKNQALMSLMLRYALGTFPRTNELSKNTQEPATA